MGSNYQRSHHDQPCCFSHFGNCAAQETVVGHHLKIAGMKSLNSKVHDALAIPVCYNHHEQCERLHITKQEQLDTWCKYMLERLTQEYGQTEAVERLAMAYWAIL